MFAFLKNNNIEYDIEFISILDREGGGIVRILVTGKNAKFAHVSVFGAKVVYIGWPQGECEFSNDRAVFSIIFNKSIKDNFKVRINGRCITQMTHEILDCLVRLKNCTFVNPEIDGFYDEVQVDESYEYRAYNPIDDDIKFSLLVPLYKTNPIFFGDLIKTILSQTYTNFEVILVNASTDYGELTNEISKVKDKRIRVVNLDKNYGIVGNTNRGIPYATGDYFMFVDHDDALSPDFLKCYLDEINRYKAEVGFYPDLLTCDEDRFTNLYEKRFRPLYKHAYCESLHMSLPPYLGHCVAVNKTALEKVELSNNDVEGSQDFDLCLKIEELNRRVAHVSEVVYHWREHESSISSGESVKPYIINSMTASIRNAFVRRSIDAEITLPRWSFIFNPRYRDTLCDIESIGFAAFDVNSINEQIYSSHSNFILIYDKSYFDNISKIDTHELIERLKVDGMAVVAPKLIYEDGTNFMVGLSISENNIVALNQNFENGVCGGYRGYAECDCNYTAVPPHIIALDKDKFTQLGGFREFGSKWLSVIDYCIRANELGFDVCVTNSLVLGVYGDVSWANLKDPRLITSSHAAVPCISPGVIWGEDSNNSYLGLGKLPDEIPRIKDRLFNKHVDYRNGYAHLKVDVPREVFP